MTMLRNSHERIAQLIADLEAIDFYDRTMQAVGICGFAVQTNMKVQDAKLAQLERLDADAYLAYIVGDEEVLNVYRQKEAGMV